MKSVQAVIIFILLNRSFAQNDTLRMNKTTISECITNHESPADGSNSLHGQGLVHKRSMNFYEPYWPEGEHVFLQTTKHPGVWSTMKKYFKPFITTAPPHTPPYEGPEMDRYRDCYRDCPNIYSYNYGRVCGFRLNTYKKWENEFMEFENMCMLEQENCKTPGIRPSILVLNISSILQQQNIPTVLSLGITFIVYFLLFCSLVWQAWHRGHCPELSDFKSYPTEAPIMQDRARNWQKDLEDSKKHPFYEHRNIGPNAKPIGI